MNTEISSIDQEKIYIDITNFMHANYMTGIQRVVYEFVKVMLTRGGEYGFQVVLITEETRESYRMVEPLSFLEHAISEKNECRYSGTLCIDEMESGSVFCDLDSAWHNSIKRSYLLPALKARNLKIAAFINDIITMTHPQYSNEDNLWRFPNFLAAHLLYADEIFTPTEYTANEFRKLTSRMQIPEKKIEVVPLGSDFRSDYDEAEVGTEARKAAEKGRFLLTVGTIEPRKNHQIILDAFMERLHDEDINIIFAGKIGWKMQRFVEELKANPYYDKRIFLLSGLNDASVKYLYDKAFAVVFPTELEGFGIPAIEALTAKTPLLASDIPVLHEIAGAYADYFDQHDSGALAQKVISWLEDETAYSERKKELDSYKAVTWSEAGELLLQKLGSHKQKRMDDIAVSQMVYLTARADDLIGTLEYVDHLMPFIKEIVVCCPDFCVEEISTRYSGRMALKFLTDSEVLAGEPLPEDHEMRNFFLRCLAMRSDVLDDCFIMSDDDYRPLNVIPKEVFFDGRYNAYYCYDLKKWKGHPVKYTSYDMGVFRTRDFLEENGYGTMQYSSHMPQIINKRYYLEMLEKYPDIMRQGLCEWSTYFNYCVKHYPDEFCVKPYVTLKWPGYVTDWELGTKITEYLFENYYDFLYEDGRIFTGFSKNYHADIIAENKKKIAKALEERSRHEREQTVVEAYNEIHRVQTGESFGITIVIGSDIKIMAPEWVLTSKRFTHKIPVSIQYKKNISAEEGFTLQWYLCTASRRPVTSASKIEFGGDRTETYIWIRGGEDGGKLMLMCTENSTQKIYMVEVPVKVSEISE